MRDPNRIDPLLEQIRDVWIQQPDMRLGQLLVVLAQPESPCPELFHLEDNQLARRLAAYRDTIEQGSLKLRYVKQRWDDSRGDEYDQWGQSWWCFEIDSLGYVLRQIEDYDNGPTNGYDRKHDEDQMGGLTDQPLDNVMEDYKEVSAGTFNSLWNSCSNRE